MAALMSWDEILKGTATTYAIRLLTLLAAYLAQRGLLADDILSPGNIAILAGALVTGGIDLAVTLYRKKKVHNLVEAAREAEPGARFATIKAEAEAKPIIGAG